MSGPTAEGGYGTGRKWSVPTLYRMVTEAIRDIPQEVADDMRRMELERLDELQTVLYQSVKLSVAAEAPVPTGTVDQILRIMDRRAKYLGFYIADDKANNAVRAGGINIRQAIIGDEPVLRPDGPIPANPVL